MPGIEGDAALGLRRGVVDIHARLPHPYRAIPHSAVEGRAICSLHELGANVLRGDVAARLDRRGEPCRLQRRMDVMHVQLLAVELEGHLLCAYASVTRPRASLAKLRVDRVEREDVGSRADLPG